jgi:hypothetical protein
MFSPIRMAVTGGLHMSPDGASSLGDGLAFAADAYSAISECADGDWYSGIGDGLCAATDAMSFFGAGGDHIGGVGSLLGAAGHATEAFAKHYDQADGDYCGNDFYNELGTATLDGADAACDFFDPTGVSGLALGAAELGVDALGTVSGWVGDLVGADTSFSAASAIGGAEHLIHDGAVGIYDGVGAAWDAVSNW